MSAKDDLDKVEIDMIHNVTKDAYSYGKWGEVEWKKCISYMRHQLQLTKAQIEEVLRSKIMRWAADSSETGKPTLDNFINFITNDDAFDEFVKEVQE